MQTAVYVDLDAAILIGRIMGLACLSVCTSVYSQSVPYGFLTKNNKEAQKQNKIGVNMVW